MFSGYGGMCVKPDETRHGPIKIFYKDGTPRREGAYRNGEEHGLWKTYDSRGVLFTETRWVDGDVRTITSYHEGKKESLVTWVDGKRHGPAREWHPNGKLAKEVPYRDGEGPHGISRHWDEEGQLTQEIVWDHGRIEKIRDYSDKLVDAGADSP